MKQKTTDYRKIPVKIGPSVAPEAATDKGNFAIPGTSAPAAAALPVPQQLLQ